MGGALSEAAVMSGAAAAVHLAPVVYGGEIEPVQVWRGVDIDGDGEPDFYNPTGEAVRGEDAYGSGHFEASRDGGRRLHVGVDFMAQPGQAVAAPISGYVTRIGYAYADDHSLRYVEITNPALNYTARAFYVSPTVAEGDVVALGDIIGRQESLLGRYKGGMTNHVHLEITNAKGRHLDAAGLLRSTVDWVEADAG